MSVFYSKDHEWVSIEGSKAKIGITDFAVHQLGDITYVELPEVGMSVKQFDTLCSIESVKAVSDIFSPVSGKVARVNDVLADKPELVNQSPEKDAWIAELEGVSESETSALMDAGAYKTYIAGL